MKHVREDIVGQIWRYMPRTYGHSGEDMRYMPCTYGHSGENMEVQAVHVWLVVCNLSAGCQALKRSRMGSGGYVELTADGRERKRETRLSFSD